jgi:hypothetical protein
MIGFPKKVKKFGDLINDGLFASTMYYQLLQCTFTLPYLSPFFQPEHQPIGSFNPYPQKKTTIR